MRSVSRAIVNAENAVEEVDRSDELLRRIRGARGIDGVISVVGPRSAEHPVQAAPQGTEDGLRAEVGRKRHGGHAAVVRVQQRVELCDRDRSTAPAGSRSRRARSAWSKCSGEHAGWLALQAGMAVCADAVLIPEIPYDLTKVAAKLRARIQAQDGRRPGGRRRGRHVRRIPAEPQTDHSDSMKASLSPGATGRRGLT